MKQSNGIPLLLWAIGIGSGIIFVAIENYEMLMFSVLCIGIAVMIRVVSWLFGMFNGDS